MFECVAEINVVMANMVCFLRHLQEKIQGKTTFTCKRELRGRHSNTNSTKAEQTKVYQVKAAGRQAWQYKIHQENSSGWNA